MGVFFPPFLTVSGTESETEENGFGTDLLLHPKRDELVILVKCYFGAKKCDFGAKNGDFGAKKCDFGVKKCDFGIKNSDFGAKKEM